MSLDKKIIPAAVAVVAFGPECMMSPNGYHSKNERTGKCGWCGQDM